MACEYRPSLNSTTWRSDVSRTPLLDAWRRAKALSRHPMQVPGHKMRFSGLSADADVLGADLLTDTVRDDVPLQGGVDDNAFTHHYLEDAEALWSEAVGADHSRFLVGGSSQGNIAALSAVARPGEPVAVDRTSHRSTQSALVVSGARPVWIYPRLHPEFHLPIGMDAASIDNLSEVVTGVFVTSPSYIGTLSGVGELAEAAHRLGIPLVIDQAWGAHLGFMPGRGAMESGADLSVTSVHKALMGYSQTAVVTMRDGLIERSQVDRCVDLTSTTSPSGTLMATIDAARAVMERDGTAALARTIEAVAEARRRLARVPGLIVLDDDNALCPVDPMKITLVLPRTGASGVDVGRSLWDLGHGPESADRDTVVLTVTVMDDPAFIAGMADLIAAIIDIHRGAPQPFAPSAVWQVEPEVVMTPREAFFGKRRRIPMSEAAGQVSAEQFCPYPPGVPLLAPGEAVTQETIEAIQAAGRICRVAYCSDPTLETIEVVDGS
jgi:lysine decarboxylase